MKNDLTCQLKREAGEVETSIVSTINQSSETFVQPALQHVADATATLSNDVTAASVKIDFQEKRVETLLTRLQNATSNFDATIDNKCNTAIAKFHHRCSEIMDGHIDTINKVATKIQDRPSSVQIPTKSWKQWVNMNCLSTMMDDTSNAVTANDPCCFPFFSFLSNRSPKYKFFNSFLVLQGVHRLCLCTFNNRVWHLPGL